MPELSKLITQEQLKKLANRGMADSAARIAELAELVATGFQNVRHTGFTLSLPAVNWSSNSQTVYHAALLADGSCRYFLAADADCLQNYSSAGVYAENISVNGQITFRCYATPAANLTVHIIRLEVEP